MSEDILDQIDAALADASSCLCGCTTALTAASPSPWFASEECQVRWNERQIRIKNGTEKAAAQVEAASPVPLMQCATSPWVSFADVAAGPSAGGNPATVDLRRRVQDGTAPVPGVDRVHDAFRAEVIRQGLREYSVDGVRYIVDDAGRLQAAADRLETLSLECGMGNPLCSGCDGLARHNNGRCMHDCHPHGWWLGRERVDELWRELDAEPVPPHVDAAPEPDQWVNEFADGRDYLAHLGGVSWGDAPLPPRRHRCAPQTRGSFESGRFGTVERCACGAIRKAGEPEWLERNARRSDEAAPWWRRMLPGGKR